MIFHLLFFFLCALSPNCSIPLDKIFSPIAPNFLSTCKFTTWFASSVLTLREFWENWMTPWGSLLPLMVILAVWRRGSIMAAPDGPMPAQKQFKKTNIYNLELKCTHTLVYDFYLWWTLQCFTSFFIYVRLAKILFFLQKSKLGFVEITILLVQKFWFETFLNTRSKGQLAQLFNSYRRNLIKVIRVHACKRNIPVSRISSFSWFFFFILHALNL